MTLRPPTVLPLSAASSAALDDATDALALDLAASRDRDLVRWAERLWAECRHQAYRRIVVATEPAEAAQYLRDRNQKRVRSARVVPNGSLIFMFSGVGDQYAGLAAGLYRSWPSFRRQLDRCFRLLAPEIGTDLKAVLYPAEATDHDGRAAQAVRADLFEQRDEGLGEGLHRTIVAQPLMFALQYALATALQSFGIVPAAVLGYSLGEYVAACVAGTFPLERALQVVAHRARLISELPPGAMLAAVAPAATLEPYLGNDLSVGAVDAPEFTVLSGSIDAVHRVEQQLAGDRIACRRLPTAHAYHSAMMDAAVAPFHDLVAGVALRPPEVPLLSNLTGTWLRAEEATDPAYWARQLRHCVRFADDLDEAWQLPSPALLELGPGRALSALALQSRNRPREHPATVLQSLPGPFETRSDVVVLLLAVGQLWTLGFAPALHEWKGYKPASRGAHA